MDYKEIDQAAKELDRVYKIRGKAEYVGFYTSPKSYLYLRTQSESAETKYSHYQNGSRNLHIEKNLVDIRIHMRPKCDDDVFNRLPEFVILPDRKFYSHAIKRAPFIRRWFMRRHLEAFFEGSEFPFDRYPAEAEALTCLIFGYRKIEEFNGYLQKVFPEFVNLIGQMEGSQIEPARAMEIIDAPLTEEGLKQRMAEAVEKESFEEAAYYRDKISEIKSKNQNIGRLKTS